MTNAHATTAAPSVFRDLDVTGEEFELETSPIPPTPRRLRARADTGTLPGAPAPVEAPRAAQVATHADRGAPDARRGTVTDLTPAALAPEVEEYSNARSLVVVDPESPPDRPRQGWTGADPARAATYRRPWLLRLFDKGMAEHPGQLDKAYMSAPLAATPKHLSDLSNPEPFAGGSTGTETAGVGPGRNTFRIMPRAWDALLVDTGGPAASAANPDPAASAAAAQVTRGRFR